MWTCPRLKEMMKSALPHYPLSSVVPKSRRSTEDFANINGFSMMVFIILMALLTHGHGMSFQNRCLGFPKRACFPKFMKMVAHGALVTDGLDEFRSLRSEDTKRYKNNE